MGLDPLALASKLSRPLPVTQPSVTLLTTKATLQPMPGLDQSPLKPGTPAHPLEAPMQTLESPPSDSSPKPVHSDTLLMSPKLKTSLRRPSKRKMRASEMKKKSLTSREPMMAGQ